MINISNDWSKLRKSILKRIRKKETKINKLVEEITNYVRSKTEPLKEGELKPYQERHNKLKADIERLKKRLVEIDEMEFTFWDYEDNEEEEEDEIDE